MEDFVYKFMNSIAPLSKENFDKSFSEIKIKSYQKGDFLFEIGKVSGKIYFVLEGITRTYALNYKNKEVNKFIASKGELVAAVESLLKNKPSFTGCQCLTDSVVLEIDYEKFTSACSANKEMQLYELRLIEREAFFLEQRYAKLLSSNATELYLNLIQKIPDIEQLIPAYHIASYIGVSRVQLGRIRKKLLHD
jgi:CRP-like cAMP-binding protein